LLGESLKVDEVRHHRLLLRKSGRKPIRRALPSSVQGTSVIGRNI
jgi:hypothetical protein